MKKIFLFIFLLLSSWPSLLLSQEKLPELKNPFLTPEEEMKELGIKSPAKFKEVIPLKELKLTGIIYGEQKFAIINSNFYTEGDSIGNFVIKEIKPLSIVLVGEEKEVELKLKHILAVSEAKVEKEKPEQQKEEESLEEEEME